MKTDDFEKKLQRQSLRQIPAAWREGILVAANSTARAATPVSHPSRLRAFRALLSNLFWPHPKAWAGLAAVWLVILSMHLYTADHATKLARKDPPPSPELILALEKQRRELARLIEPTAFPDAEQRKSFRPSPRSERRDERLAA